MTLNMAYGKYLISDSKTVIPNGAVVYEDGIIVDVGPYADMKNQYLCDHVYGSAEMIVTPGFVNAHGHGRGLTDFQLGTKDDVLEVWKYRSYPGLNSYYDTLWRSILMLESGITATMHNHNLVDPNNFTEEFHRAIDAYENAGIRVAFAPTLIDDNIVIYGDREQFQSFADPQVMSLVHSIEEKTKIFDLPRYLTAIDELLETRSCSGVNILHAPLAPQWCTQNSLETIAGHAAEHNMKVHIHVLQTVLQKEFARRYLSDSMIGYLDSIGILSPNTTCGHAIWLSEKEISTLAASGTSVTTHSSCNLRIQSGLSPVRAMLESGIKIGIGMDDKTLNDQKDYFSEIRLTARLHRLGSYDMLTDPLPPHICFKMATEWGADILGFSHSGTLRPGHNADIVLMNYAAMTHPYTYPEHSPIDVLLYRGSPQHVDSVIVDGRLVLHDGKHQLIDKEEIIARLLETFSREYAEKFKAENDRFLKLKEALSSFYHRNGWYDYLSSAHSPYYRIHDRI